MALRSVTQATNKSTAVTINKLTGKIVLNNASLVAGTEVSFTVNNSTVGADDVVVVNHASAGTAGAYMVQANSLAAGSFKITVTNLSGGDLGEAIVLQYKVLRNMG